MLRSPACAALRCSRSRAAQVSKGGRAKGREREREREAKDEGGWCEWVLNLVVSTWCVAYGVNLDISKKHASGWTQMVPVVHHAEFASEIFFIEIVELAVIQ